MHTIISVTAVENKFTAHEIVRMFVLSTYKLLPHYTSVFACFFSLISYKIINMLIHSHPLKNRMDFALVGKNAIEEKTATITYHLLG